MSDREKVNRVATFKQARKSDAGIVDPIQLKKLLANALKFRDEQRSKKPLTLEQWLDKHRPA